MTTSELTVLGDDELSLVIPVVPMPAPRPRMSKWGAYFPATYTAHKKEIAVSLPKRAVPLMGELHVVVELVCKRIGKSKFTTPAGDLDNLVKPTLDVLTQEGYYGDDRQITDLRISKRFPVDGEDPHINVHIKQFVS